MLLFVFNMLPEKKAGGNILSIIAATRQRQTWSKMKHFSGVLQLNIYVVDYEVKCVSVMLSQARFKLLHSCGELNAN